MPAPLMAVDDLTPAALVHAGRRVPLEGELTLGRGEDNDVVVPGERVSRRHARIGHDRDGWWIEDLGSRHGTLVNGHELRGRRRRLAPGDEVVVGEERLRFLSGAETRMASRAAEVVEIQTVRLEGERLTLGRDEHNDVVLADPNVSRFHAEVVRGPDGAVVVKDLGSRNGTRVDGELVDQARLEPGSEIGIGPFGLRFDGESLVARDEHGALRMTVEGLAMRVGDKQILAPLSLALEPGEFVAIIGESGAGKSTLLKAMAGVHAPSAGQVEVNEEPLAARLTDIGYVPQDDIVHRFLTVREALRYAARLRLPQDAAPEEIDAAVERVLGELSLAEHAETRVGSLSGGQRKRTGVAVELLSRPSLVFLDEPTSGLDPGLETQMMQLMRELADRGRAVVVVTHATKNLALCDKVIVMGRGGELAYFGPPPAAQGFFGVEDYDGVYTALASRPAEEWRARFEADRDGGPEEGTAAGDAPVEPARRRERRILPQTRVLISRYWRLFVRDRRNLALLIGQAPLLALFNVALFKSGIFDQVGGRPGDAVQLLFLLAITTIWLGSIDAAPELVKERSVFERESAVGMRLSSYLFSKLAVLFAVVAVQVLLYVGVTCLFRPLDEPLGTYAAVFGLLLATGFVAVAMGLLISAVVTTQDQAMSLVPLAVIPQLLFAGTIVPLARMAEPAHTIAYAIFSQWSLAGVGTAVGMNGRMAADPEFARFNRFGPDFFDVPEGTALLVLAGFFALFMLGVVLLLRRAAR